MNIEDRFLRLFETTQLVKNILNPLSIEDMMPIYCMISEEYAKYNGLDVIDFMKSALEMVREVNEEEGQYI